MKSILSIAGFDTSCGAGICADVKTARSLSFYACSAITAITYQNSCGVEGFAPTGENLSHQLKAIVDDIPINAVKMGMLPDENTVKVLKTFLKDLKGPKVLDPVIKSTTGVQIGSVTGYKALMPLCDIITPNAFEASQLTGLEVTDVRSARKAVAAFDGISMVIKGVNGRDIIYDAYKEKTHVMGKELDMAQVHGTGCVYSTALACYLAGDEDLDLYKACKKARRLTISAARKAINIGECLPVVNP